MNRTHVMQRALRQAARNLDRIRLEGEPPATAEELAEEAQEVLARWEEEAAHECEQFGGPEDTPCLQSCDLWGTGEGRYHGVIG